MNTTDENHPPALDTSPAAILKMREFLARVVRTAPAAIKITGNPETDENTDLLTANVDPEDKADGVLYASLCKLTAMEIDSILAGHTPGDLLPDGQPDLERGALMFSQFVGNPPNLYP